MVRNTSKRFETNNVVGYTCLDSSLQEMARHLVARTTVSKTGVIFAICAVLAGLTWLVFGQTLTHQFVTYDDPQYVYENANVAAGLSAEGVSWALTHKVGGNWHPLTTISHMFDCQLYGLKPNGHHFSNVVLHTIAVILLFLVLRQMTGALWQSVFVAALFAIHPLHVESVAWISERKDVLSAVFFMLTLGAYLRYVRTRSLTSYFLLLLVFAFGLMSKPMLVTVPFVLLLLDYWPLGRIREAKFARDPARQPAKGQWSVISGLITEKIPLFALSALSSAVTLLTQLYSTAPIDQLPFAWRLNNAAVSYIAYIWQMFWPASLAAFYPHPNDRLALWQVLLAIAFLIAVSFLAIHWRKERPYIFTGWFWYAGMLVPVIGLVQAGEQARADRYTYLPQIGLYVLLAWGFTDLMMATRQPAVRGSQKLQTRRPRAFGEFGERPHGRAYKPFCFGIAAAIIIALSWRAFVQASYWKDTETLWNHTLAVTSDNDVAHNNLGYLSLQRGELDSAISHFETALMIRSRNLATHYNFGGALIENSLANALARKGLLSEAADHYANAVRLRPDYGDPYLNLGTVLFEQGRTGEAIAEWQKAVTTQPKDAGFHTALANGFLKGGLQRDAMAEYEHATRISPDDPVPANDLAWLLATSSDASIRDGNRAVEFAKHAVQLSRGKDPNYLRTLAAAFAESGSFPDARETARRALQAAERRSNSSLATALQDEIALYELRLPYHK
jgi:tetratricopeptide (TPR) repeat protein